MADDDQDQEQKTEAPTQKRLDEAMKKGNVPFSREVSNFLTLAMLALTVSWLAPSVLSHTARLLAPFLADADNLPADPAGLGRILTKVMFGGAAAIALPLAGAIIATLTASLLQHGFVLSNEPIMPQFSRISPLAGIKRLFSARSLMEFVKGILKILLVGLIAFIAVYPETAHIRQLPGSSAQAMLAFLAMLAMRMTTGVAVAMFFIAIFDLLFQRYQYAKSLRMSRQEIKDEFKQSEGDPMVKQRLRRLRHDRARKRMMAAVPKADVVITNPTHFAVALEYDTKRMKAPVVVARGQDIIALKIREIAEEHKVPVVENPPLARALFSSTDLGEEIPVTHYEAVAKIISYIYQLKGRKFGR
ncbi:MAG: flagellar biosynthesis protein FlhB [Pseudomonadota bacterium]|nr:flagellar biosynthesis protein FlhB [Pseudomonadota bacterium]MDE3038690.1 flagellar biosynthesis protein FlhB [Pseudomonadota bacterium]